MIAPIHQRKKAFPFLLVLLLLVSGCGISAPYRSADKKTIRDFDASDTYRKQIGIMALTNTTMFTSDQITSPFMEAFLAELKSTVPKAQLLLADTAPNTPFLSNPPRLDNGDIEAFGLCAQARQAGLNAVVSPMIIDVRTSKKNTGFWFFRDVSYILQIQTAAAAYDTVTGARLALGILTEKIDISEQQSQQVKNGQEIKIAALVEVIREMGEQLAEQLGEAIEDSRWASAIISIEDGRCGIPAGSKVGIKPGDRFSVLGVSNILTGLNGQRFVVPGVKIDDITIGRVTDQHALGSTESGSPPPMGSIVIPDK
jgi:hypothetical protein